MVLDIARLRAETPGVAARIHFNNAGAALMPAPVVDVMADHLRREAEIGGYEAADEAEARLDHVYDSVARLRRRERRNRAHPQRHRGLADGLLQPALPRR